MSSDLTSPWDFVARYYPGHTGCSTIAYNDDLQKIVDGEINGDAEKLWEEMRLDLGYPTDEDPDEEYIHELVKEMAQKELTESNEYIYEKAIQGYIDEINTNRNEL